MIQGLLQSPVSRLMEMGLDATALRHQVLSNNIANVETPNFKASQVSFEEELREQLSEKKRLSLVKTNDMHRPNLYGRSPVIPQIYTKQNLTMRNDGNNVDIDKEMAEDAANTIQYNTLIQQISGYFSRMSTVINEGRR